MATKPPPAVLTVTEASTLLKLSRSKVYLLISMKAVEAFKIGSNWRIRTSSVHRLLPSAPKQKTEASLESIEGTTA